MNREILFRGKRVDNGEWAYGVYVPEKSVILGYFEVNSLDTDCDLINCKAVVRKVNSKTVGQYTGLTDRNGVKIFEGDIVRVVYDGNVYIYVVIWDTEELDFKATNGKMNYGNEFEYLCCCEEIEIIGNVHDNPELLKGEENV